MIKERINTEEEFKNFSSKFQKENKMPAAYGIGIYYKDSKKETIAVKWLMVNIASNLGTAAVIADVFSISFADSPIWYYETNSREDIELVLENYFRPFRHKESHLNVVALETLTEVTNNRWVSACFIAYESEEVLKQQSVKSIPDAHFRLASISRLYYKPNELCLDNMFSVLPNLVWKKDDVMTVEDWNYKQWVISHSPDVEADKIPLLSWGAPIPLGVRMPNPHSARLGAYLSSGTTIMPYGFVNFNAGTLGAAMVEGTIASGVTIGDGTDIGKAGGFLGTLSGGNTVKIFTGKNCLIGALAECGIPLGDNCVVATGVCFTANTPIFNKAKGEVQKAIEFSGQSNITFRRNSMNGRLEVIQKGNKAELNEVLHQNENNVTSST